MQCDPCIHGIPVNWGEETRRKTATRGWGEPPTFETSLTPQLPFWLQDLLITSETTGANRFTWILRTSRGKQRLTRTPGPLKQPAGSSVDLGFPCVCIQISHLPTKKTELFSLKSNHGFFFQCYFFKKELTIELFSLIKSNHGFSSMLLKKKKQIKNSKILLKKSSMLREAYVHTASLLC